MFEVVDKEVNMKVILAVMYTTWAVVKIRPEKNSGLYRIWTHDLCNTGASVKLVIISFFLIKLMLDLGVNLIARGS